LINLFWQNFKDDNFQRIKALSVMAHFYFFVKNDLLKSIDFWKEWMRSQSEEFYVSQS